MLRNVLVLSIPVAVAVVAACGGQVVFVEDGGEGGAGGSTTSAQTTKGPGGMTKATTQSVTTKSVASTVGQGPAPGVTATSTGSGLICDTGELGELQSDLCSKCQQCTLQEQCQAEFQQCNNVPECFEFNDCWGACGFDDPGCFQMCADQVPDGVGPLMAVYDCVLCQNCPFNCSGANFCGEG